MAEYRIDRRQSIRITAGSGIALTIPLAADKASAIMINRPFGNAIILPRSGANN